jgi:hypothetical protein
MHYCSTDHTYIAEPPYFRIALTLQYISYETGDLLIGVDSC